MQTLVIGCGTIGSTIAALLCREGHNVTVIDRSRDNVQNVTDSGLMGMYENRLCCLSKRYTPWSSTPIHTPP